MDKKTLLQTLQNNPSLEKTFRAFVKDTFSQLNKDGKVIDLIGKDNIALIEDIDGPHLVLLDPHVIHDINKVSKKDQEVLSAFFDYLKDIVNILDTSDPS